MVLAPLQLKVLILNQLKNLNLKKLFVQLLLKF